MGSLLRHAGSFVVAHGLLSSSYGVWVFSSLVVARGLCSCGTRAPGCVGSVVCSTWALVEARELSSCGVRV